MTEQQMQLPAKWEITKLGNVLSKIIGGGTPSKNNPDFWGGNVPWLTVKDMRTTRPMSAKDHITDLAVKESSTNVIPADTVIIATRIGLGKVVRVPFKAAINQDLKALILPETIEKSYLEYWLISKANYLESIGSGTTVKGIRLEQLKNIDFPLAPQKIQKQIVAKIEELFSHIDAGIESLKIAQEKLKQYRQSVLKAAVTGELTKEWREQNSSSIEPDDQLLKRIQAERRQRWEQQKLAEFQAKGKPPKNDKWKEKYKEPEIDGEAFFDEIPSEWLIASIDSLACDVRYGSSSKTNDDSQGVPVIRMGNIVDGKIDYSNLKYLPTEHKEFPDLLLKDKDLLFNRTNSAELVGKTAVFFDKGRPVSLASYLIRVRFLSGVEAEFIAHFINSIIGRTWIKSCVSQNVGQANVNGTKLKALVVPLPSLEEQKEIVQIVEEKLASADRLMNEIETKLTQAQQQKQTILVSAFSGRLI